MPQLELLINQIWSNLSLSLSLSLPEHAVNVKVSTYITKIFDYNDEENVISLLTGLFRLEFQTLKEFKSYDELLAPIFLDGQDQLLLQAELDGPKTGVREYLDSCLHQRNQLWTRTGQEDLDTRHLLQRVSPIGVMKDKISQFTSH